MPTVPEDVSPKCKVHLEQTPDCGDVNAMRGYAICWAQWIGVRQEKLPFSDAMKEGWRRAKETCQVA